MAGSSSDPAVTGPAAFAAVQLHNRETTIADQAKEIKDLKRKLEEQKQSTSKVFEDRNEIVAKAIKLRTKMIKHHDQMMGIIDYAPPPVREQALCDTFNADSAELENRILDIAPSEWEDSSEEGDEEEGDEAEGTQQEQ